MSVMDFDTSEVLYVYVYRESSFVVFGVKMRECFLANIFKIRKKSGFFF